MANADQTRAMQRSTVDELEHLRSQFTKYRESRSPGQRVPHSLRQAVLEALSNGVSASELHRVCRVTARQIRFWKNNLNTLISEEATVSTARVLKVVPTKVEQEAQDKEIEMCLRVGPWRLKLSLEGNGK